MKRSLLGSAAAIALAASGAAAQEWSAKVGGFFTGAVAALDIGQDGNDFALIRDSEIHFNFRLVADNGLTFGSRFELDVSDGNNGSTGFDEVEAFVSGAFGAIYVGEGDGAADGPMGSGDVGADFVRAADGTGVLFDFYEGVADNQISIRAQGADTSDAIKLTYFTPEFSGFKAGVSWVPSLATENGRATPVDSANEQNAIEVGASWSGEFSGFSIAVGGGWVSDTVVGADDDSSFAGGATIGFAGFEVGANYGYIEEDESDHLGVGVAYKTGPWKVGADYGLVMSSDDAGREDDMGVAGGVSYALAPGVVTGVTVEWSEDGAAGGEDNLAGALWLSFGY